ncbi:MAG TPA: DUF1634 domain-containing protein [Gemmatimonadaceae bacterium]|nr:DUF1634 domain-containing protein [Gemmatimonadaceae bacterium]
MSEPLWRTGRWSDEHVELFVGNLLRWGVIIAAAVTVVGGALFLALHGGRIADYHVFHGQPDALKSVSDVVANALRLQPEAVIQLGLLLLIATPIARVALSLLAFVKQHDRTYIVVTAIVLGLLLYSLTGAGA